MYIVDPHSQKALINSRPVAIGAEMARMRMQSNAWLMLEEEHEDLAKEWLQSHVGEARMAHIGPPDLSANPILDICTQLSTPGLYGIPPAVQHPDRDGAALPFCDPSAALFRSGFWTKLQTIQKKTIGLGDLVVCDELTAGGELLHRIVAPHDVVALPSPSDPSRWLGVRELRARWHPVEQAWGWYWDIADLSGPDGPVLAVCRAHSSLEPGPDESNIFLRVDGAPAPKGGLAGDAYPYRWTKGERAGEPFLPYSVYRVVDTGRTWNPYHQRGAKHGTLNTIRNQTYVGYVALSATGKPIITWGIRPAVGEIQTPEGQAAGARRIWLEPGSALVCEVDGDGKVAGVFQAQAGADLASLESYADRYAMQIAVRMGLNPSDLHRVSADPASGAALAIGQQGRREYSAQVKPLFQRVDIERLEKCAALLNGDGHDLPEDGYAIEYATIPLSPQEQDAQRLDIDWQEERGMISPVEAYQMRHPGASDAAAEAAIVRAAIDKARLQRTISDSLTALGLDPVETEDDTDTDNGQKAKE